MRRHRGTEGASAVEFALVLPVLITLLFGTMYGASLFNSQQTVTQAAREAARFGATVPVSEQSDTDAWLSAVATRAQNVLAVDRPLTPGAVDVCVRLYVPDGTTTTIAGSAVCPPAASAGDMEGPRVEVTTSREARLELGISSIGPINLTSTATARYEPDDL